MTGNCSMNHLVNDSLMPELWANADEQVFGEIWRNWNGEIATKHRAFIHPASACHLVGLAMPKDLLMDWDALAILAEKIEKPLPLKKLFGFFPQRQAARFFSALLWQVLYIQYHQLFFLIRTEPSIKHQQYLLMNYLMQLEQWMQDNERKISANNSSLVRHSFHYFLSFFWLNYHRKYVDLIHLASLRYFKEDLEFTLNNMQPETIHLQQHLLQQLKVSPPKSLEEFEKAAPESLVAGISSPKNTKATEQKHLQNPLKMEDDVYLQPRDVKAEFGIAPSTLAKYRTIGKLKIFRKHLTRYEYSRKEIIEFLNRKNGM